MLGAILDWVKRNRPQKGSHGPGLPNLSVHLRERQQELDRLLECPPPCGSAIRYAQEYAPEDVYGEFLFQAADVERELNALLQDNPGLRNGDEGALLHWLQGRDESVSEPSDVPGIWSRFKYIADSLVLSGKGAIYCRACGVPVQPENIVINDDKGTPGWNFDRIQCPQGHSLLIVESMHILT